MENIKIMIEDLGRAILPVDSIEDLIDFYAVPATMLAGFVGLIIWTVVRL